MAQQSGGCFGHAILLIGALLFLFTGAFAIYSPIYRYVCLGTSLDLVRDAYSIGMGTIMVFLPYVFINKKLAFRFLFSFSLFFSILGMIACIFFWQNTAGQNFEVGDKSEHVRFIYLCVFAFSLGFSLLAVKWQLGKAIMIVAVAALSACYTVMYFLDGLYVKMLLAIYGFFVVALMYRNIASLLSIIFSMIMPYYVLDFIQYGRVTWFFGLNTHVVNNKYVNISKFEPENYINVADHTYTFYFMVGVDIVLSLIIGYIIVVLIIFGALKNEFEFQKLANQVFPIIKNH